MPNTSRNNVPHLNLVVNRSCLRLLWLLRGELTRLDLDRLRLLLHRLLLLRDLHLHLLGERVRLQDKPMQMIGGRLNKHTGRSITRAIESGSLGKVGGSCGKGGEMRN